MSDCVFTRISLVVLVVFTIYIHKHTLKTLEGLIGVMITPESYLPLCDCLL